MEKVRYAGTYHFFDFKISHKVLLLRKREQFDTENSDLIFGGVFYLETPTHFTDFEIYEAGEELKQQIIEKAGEKYYPELNYHKVFIIKSEGKEYYIGCAILMEKKNNLNYFDSSIRP